MREIQNLDSKAQKKKSPAQSGSSKGTVSVSYKVFFLASLLFLVIPVILFCLGYLRPLIGFTLAVCFAGMTAIAFFDCVKDADGNLLDKQSIMIEIPVRYLVIFAVSAVLVSLITGVGEYVFTLQDHPYRRAILRDLVNYDWPVIYNYNTQTVNSTANTISSILRKLVTNYSIALVTHQKVHSKRVAP